MATDLLPVPTEIPLHSQNENASSRPIGSDRELSEGVGIDEGHKIKGNVDIKQSSDQSLDVRQPAVLKDCLQLTKPRIVTMILVTTVATAIIGAGGMVAAASLVWLLVGTAAVAASAGAANQVWERVIDGRMARTANRPLPDGRISPALAIGFTTALLVVGTALLHWQFGIIPAAVGLATWFSYVVIYTPMKIRSQWNTTIGAIAGALPMLIGYTATGGSLTDATGWLLVGLSIAWQYPHFMAIAWMYRRQYGEAGFQMTTTVEPTGRDASIQSILGSVVLILVAIALVASVASPIYSVLGGIAVTAAGIPMLRASIGFAKARDDIAARKLLRSSLLVLPIVLLITTVGVFW